MSSSVVETADMMGMMTVVPKVVSKVAHWVFVKGMRTVAWKVGK